MKKAVEPRTLTEEEQLRYARHLVLPRFGEAGQRRLLDGSVLLVGVGGLGSPAGLYLAAAGVGRLGIVDDDVVELSNLQRQVLHRTRDAGLPKTDSARRALADCNPLVRVEAVRERFTDANARDLVRRFDLVVDGADNFPTRYLINDAAVLEGKPVIHGSVFHFEGQVAVFDPPRGPCYRCLFPDPPEPGAVPSCAEAGVLGVLPGVVGLLQATEAIKRITGLGDSLLGCLLIYNALGMTFRKLKILRNPECPLCGEHPSIREARMLDWSCAAPGSSVPQMALPAYRKLRDAGDEHLLLDVREASEVLAGSIPGHWNIPVGVLENRLPELSHWRERLIVCQCQSGVRSQRAAEILAGNGFRNVVNLAGGYLAWLKAAVHNR